MRGRRSHGRRELSTVDSFADAYMGKRYYRSNGEENMRHYEVLSTGVEAIFHGEYGGLVGVGRVAADTDMRAFALGVLATVQPKARIDSGGWPAIRMARRTEPPE